MLKINEKEMQELCRHAVDRYPKECCGILLGNRKMQSVRKIYRAGNIAETDRQKTHFLMNPLELYRVEKEAEKDNMEIVGFYHSHPNYPSVLSAEDREFMIQGYLYVVISVVDGICREIKCFVKTETEDSVCELPISTDRRQTKGE